MINSIQTKCQIDKRFLSKEECKLTLESYLQGARMGTVGHFSSYPLNIANINYNFLETLKYHINCTNNVLGMYIHWPYCYLPGNREKCDFCMCNTKNDPKSKALKGQYFETIINEIRMYATVVKNPIKSLYIGGGTPLTMSINELRVLFDTLYKDNIINKDTYISIETRPEVLTDGKMKILSEFCVNRISLGVESFNNYLVKGMGRGIPGYEYSDFVDKAINLINKYKISSYNIDLIYGHPDENIDMVKESLIKALAYKPDSLSVYVLGLPSKLTLLENERNIESRLKPLSYRLECSKMISNILTEENYIPVAESIWSKYDMYSSGEDDFGVEFYNIWNQTNTLGKGIWLGIGVGAGGYIEGIGPITNEGDIEKYIELVAGNLMGVVKGSKLTNNELMRSELILSLLHSTTTT